MTRSKTESEDREPAPESPDYEALARQYLDLWQDQFAAMAADPGTVETLSKMTAAWREAMFSFLQGTGTAAPFGDFSAIPGIKGASDDANRVTRDTNDAIAAGPQAPDGASGRSDADVDALVQRIADLETRLAALERKAGSKAKPKRKAAAGKSAKKS